MQRSCRSLSRFLASNRGFCTSSKGSRNDKIVASVLFERLSVVIPKIDAVVYGFQEFSFRWRQQFRRAYPEEFLQKSDARGKGEYHIDFVPAPRITEADKINDKKNLNLIYGFGTTVSIMKVIGDSYGTPKGQDVWHFPEKVYKSEETLRKCTESALESVIGDLSHTYFVGNAPMGHIAMPPGEKNKDTPSFKRFFFKSQVIATNKVDIKSKDFVWVTKDELLEYFPKHSEYLTKMIIS
ncbi:hypothetical protein LXL04_027827 [Taraxacum kok-saghyz]